MIRFNQCYSYNQARQMRDKAKRAKKIKSAVKDLSYLLVSSFIVLGVVKSGQLITAQIKPVEAVQTMSSQIIELPPQEKIVIKEVEVPTVSKGQLIDGYVGEAVDTYFEGSQASEMRMIMHCLLNKESKHNLDKGLGDGGKAGGAMQFWQGTWERMRRHMISDGFATEIGSRDNLEQAVQTTAYAIYKGWGLEWGPLLRTWNGAGWASCPLPSWY